VAVRDFLASGSAVREREQDTSQRTPELRIASALGVRESCPDLATDRVAVDQDQISLVFSIL
jgi:hypothetical protein